MPEIDACLPAGGLALGALHEVAGGGHGALDGAVASLFAAGILARMRGPVLRCAGRRDLFAPALALARLHPEVIEDYGHVGLTLRRHPVSFLRYELSQDRILSCAEANARPDRRRIKVAGLVLVRQRPGTAKGVTFITIEDETGIANLVVWADLYERQRRTVLTANMLAVEGRVQREGLVVHIVADWLIDLTERLAAIGEQETVNFPHGRGDNFRGEMLPDPRDPGALRLKTRNFH
ncbi:MAG TPA: OB-fold nucleic acid binding domain-containing protein [Micropepsaceae bacterium]|nr:OB-fold nucleic acid binding domain-containing protein [Micropepsaceae bacterium]